MRDVRARPRAAARPAGTPGVRKLGAWKLGAWKLGVRKPGRRLDGWKLAALLTPLLALLVVLGDVAILLGRTDLARWVATLGPFPWALLLFPAVLVGGFMVGFRTSPAVGAAVLLASIAVERFQATLLPNGAINLRLDEVLGPAIAIGLMVSALRWQDLGVQLRRVPGALPLGLFLLSNLIPTLLMQNRARGFSLFAILIAGGLCYVCVALLAGRVDDVRGVVAPLLLVGGLEALFGLGAWMVTLFNGGHEVFGVQLNAETQQLEPYGTMYEANFFGQYLAAVMLIAIAVLFGLAAARALRAREQVFLMAVAGLTGAGVLISMTRASWLGLLVGALALALLWPLRGAAPWRRGRAVIPRRELALRWLPVSAVGAAGLVVVAALLALAGTDSPLGQRFAAIFNFTSGSGYGRLRILQLVIEDWRNPIVGMGDGSFNVALAPLPGHAPDAPWIYSMFIAVLHDSGIVGLALFTWLLFVVYRGLVRTIRRAPDQRVQALAVGMAAALTSILVASQATTSMYLVLFWALFGLAAATPLLARAPWARHASDAADGTEMATVMLPARRHISEQETVIVPALPNVAAQITRVAPARADVAELATVAIPALRPLPVRVWSRAYSAAPLVERAWSRVYGAAFVVPLGLALIVLWVTWTRTASVPYGDEWFMTPIVEHADSGTLSLGELIAPFNTHRLFIQRIVDLGLIELTHWNRQVEITVHYLVAVAAALLIFSCVRSAFRSRLWPFALMAPLALLLVGLGQEENWFDAFNLGFIGTGFGVALACRALYTPSGQAVGWRRFALAMLAALVASLSNAAGLLVWIAFLPVVSRLDYRRLAIWAGSGLVAWVAYFNGNPFGSNGQRPSILNQLQYMLAYLGAPAGAYIEGIAILVGALSVVVLLVNLALYYRMNGTLAPIVIWISIGLFGLGCAASTTFGRSDMGLLGAMSFRYQAFSAYWWVAIFVTCALVVRQHVDEVRRRRPSTRRRAAAEPALVAASLLFLAVAFTGILAMNYRGLHWGIIWSDNLRSHQQCVVDYETAPDSCLSIYLTSLAFKPLLQDSARYMQERHLAIFSHIQAP